MKGKHLMRCALAFVLMGIATGSLLATVAAAEHELVLREVFGVSHPPQIVSFDLPQMLSAGEVAVLDDAGQPVVFQLLDGGRRVALGTDLPAGRTKRWTLVPAAPAVPADDPSLLRVQRHDDFLEITSSLVGLRVPLIADSQTATPAPVRAVRHRDGTWTPHEPVYLSRPAQARNVQVVEQGPLKVVLQIEYQLARTALRDDRRDVQVADEGTGYYRCRIELQAGQPSILFEEDADVDVSWSLDLSEGLEPDQARYRGHHARQKEHGYESDGRPYRAWHERPAIDAHFDLPYDRSYASNYQTNLDQYPAIRRMAVWDPWAFDSGWYWMLYRRDAGDGGNVVGLFAGPPSRAIGAANSGTGVFTRGGDPPRGAGLTVGINRRSPDARAFSRVRYAWGLFFGTRGEHLLPPDEIQPINRQMNLHSGFNLDKIHRYVLSYPDPPRGYGALYMSREVLQRMIDRLRADDAGPHGDGYHGYLYRAEPSARPLIDMWADPSGQKAREAAERIESRARDMLDALVHRGGIYEFGIHYWHGGLEMSRLAVWIDQVLAGDALDDDQRDRVRAAAALFGYILWDNDFVPLDGQHGLNLGTANMPVQQNGYRHQYALLLAEHPEFSQRAAGVADAALEAVRATINEHGAHMGSSHYLGASMGPVLNTLVQLRQSGILDAFSEEDRLARFAEFYMQFATPPDPRYDNQRIRIPTGNAEANNPQFLAGVLGTAFAGSHPELSARLMGSWQQSGRPHTGFHASTLLMTNQWLPQADPQLASDNFPGYMSVLRSGWGTPHESALWLIAGEYYRDHRTEEHGMVSIYAHAAPLALNWGPMYSPYAPSSLIRSTLVPPGANWTAVPAPHTESANWQRSSLETFTAADDGGTARSIAHGFDTRWRRAVTLAHPAADQPVFLLQDTFGDHPLVFSLALACEEAVETDEGTRGPGEAFSLPAGVSRLRFRGQPLPLHHSGGIDWDLYVIADQAQEGFLTKWSHDNRRGQRQVILRIKSDRRFRVVIVPWPKGAPPKKIAVEHDPHRITITVDGHAAQFDAKGRRS